MSPAYHQLLDAAVAHLVTMKSRGVRFVAVTPGALAGLGPSKTPTPSRNAAPARASVPEVAEGRPATPPSPTSMLPSAAAEAVPAAAASAASVPDVARAGPETPGKHQAIDDLRARALVCVKCPHLASTRKNVVFGVGDINAALMFVGEAPGAEEDAQGEPFVGAAGQLLTKIIRAMGLSRQTVYIANILKCRPDTPAQTAGNRKPTGDEMKTCIPYLHSQIDLIGPKVLVALGGTAVEGLLGKTEGITRLRGHWREYRGIPLMPTFHPSYLLRNQSPGEKRKVWEDMMQVMDQLGMPMSEKQRDYFLKTPG